MHLVVFRVEDRWLFDPESYGSCSQKLLARFSARLDLPLHRLHFLWNSGWLSWVFELTLQFFISFAGKTTLLKILAGKHMVGGQNVVRVLNRSAFHDTQLVCSGDLAYLGGSWSKTVGSAVSSLTLFRNVVLSPFTNWQRIG